jgi:hypothetical protein
MGVRTDLYTNDGTQCESDSRVLKKVFGLEEVEVKLNRTALSRISQYAFQKL